MPPLPLPGLFLLPHVSLVDRFSMSPCFSGLPPGCPSGISLLKSLVSFILGSSVIFIEHVFRSFVPLWELVSVHCESPVSSVLLSSLFLCCSPDHRKSNFREGSWEVKFPDPMCLDVFLLVYMLVKNLDRHRILHQKQHLGTSLSFACF